MASIMIVSGSPGTGKTSLSKRLAAVDRRGLHLASDDFYRYPAHPIDPTDPASHAQNETVMRALGRAACAFAEGGYQVLVDGVIGPWFVPVVAREVRAAGLGLEYVVLRAPLEQTLRRVQARDGVGASARVRHMHRAFGELGAFAGHAVENATRSLDEVVRELARRRAAGEFAVAV